MKRNPEMKRSRSFSDYVNARKGTKDSGVKLNRDIPKGTINPRDTFATLTETLRTIPSSVGFAIEIKYPSKRYQKQEFIRYHERNVYVDMILRSVFNSLSNPLVSERKIMFLSFDPDICILLSQKQPRYPVFLLLSLGKGIPIGEDDSEIEGYDLRCNSFDVAIQFAKKARLPGVVLDALYILTNPEKVSEAHALGLLVITYGSQNMQEKDRLFQKEAGVDSFIMDNFVHIGGAIRKKSEINMFV